MQDLLNHPAVQAGIAPLLVGLIVAGALFPLRLAGLACASGFFVAVALIGNFSFETLTATRKIVVLAMVAPVLGLIADLAFKPTLRAGAVLGAVFGLATLWVFWTVLAQKPAAAAAMVGAGAFAMVIWTAVVTMLLHDDAVRAGAAGVGLGVGVGASAVLGASALLGQYGIAVGAACGGFLLVVMALGRRVGAGATLTLSAAVSVSLLGVAAVLLAQVPWYALALLGLVPLAVRLPLPQRAHASLQSVMAVFYAMVPAAGAAVFSWFAGRGGA